MEKDPNQQISAATTEELKAEIQKILDQVTPLLQTASDQINSLDKNSLAEVRTFAKPPPMVELALKCVCILLGRKPTNPKKPDDYWETSKKMLQDSHFLSSLLQLDNNKISEESMKKLQEIFDSHPEFSYENLKKVSKAASCLYSWVHGMYNYKQVLIKIEPLKKQLLALEKPEHKNEQEEEVKTENLTKKNIENEETKKPEEIPKEQNSEETHLILQKILEEVNTLNKNDVNELKALAKPPVLVMLTMQCVCILLGLKPHKLPDKTEDYWDTARKALADPNGFLNSLLNFNKDGISEKTLNKLKEIFESHPELQEENVRKCSKALACFFIWAKGIYSYGNIVKNLKKNEVQNKDKKEEEKKDEVHEVEKIAEKEEKQLTNEEKDAILQAAINSLNAINKNEITEMKSLANPPALVSFTMRLISLLLANKLPNKEFQWKDAQKIMNNPVQFLENLRSLDISKISDEVIQEVKRLMHENANFQPENVAKQNKAAKNFCIFVQGVCNSR